MTSDKVKEIKANGSGAGLLHYGFAKNDPITINHIMSLLLYCDFSKFCSSFSSTFRKLSGHEPLEEVRKRNQEFWWQSKLFREVVEIFGTLGWIDRDNWRD
eukprot:147258_1